MQEAIRDIKSEANYEVVASLRRVRREHGERIKTLVLDRLAKVDSFPGSSLSLWDGSTVNAIPLGGDRSSCFALLPDGVYYFSVNDQKEVSKSPARPEDYFDLGEGAILRLESELVRS